MIKFAVVLYRRPGLPLARFRRVLRNEHARMAEALPGLRRYVQNHVVHDPKRRRPAWDAIVELYWRDRRAMEKAWRSSEGQRATAHLATFADLARTEWSVVAEDVRR